ncbi:DUF559 domain-containing protein [Dactylosporangium sp. AC04546]|uniref:endonuclease domain-containing protein n=1 Tax=Dactylosporangium sp. AC04546 TaxID=2862460 RepID=UPI002E7AE6AF|nr:DUF559 domain-containing protein [Dactylosporangium sp. AC04546]WVK82343.1 DUF559 domain-containing protein [Dactylosporangium sp. AC04546]
MAETITKPGDGKAAWHERLAEIPVDRVVHLSGVTAADVVAAMARHDDLPASVEVVPATAGDGTAAAFVAEVVDVLDAIARQLIHGWLPESDELDGTQGAALAAIRAVAIERARAAGYASVFLADLAERALTGRAAPRARLRPEARIAGLARVIASGFRRDRLVLSMPVGNVAIAGAEWLADRGRLGIWLTGARSPGLERFSTVHLTPPPLPAAAAAGRPHPRSTVEATLEAVLRRQEHWAYGRIWNAIYQPAAVRNPIRPDLLWPAERVAVELDGPEHCRAAQYDADRDRDVRLQLDGYAVLRFTNARVRYDAQAVAAQIEHLIRTRRHDLTKGQQGG